MDWYISVWKKYAVFSGRARRAEYWYFALYNLIVSIVLGVIDMITGTISSDSGLGVLGAIYALAAFIPSLAVLVRRLHDTGRGVYWLLIALIPIVGLIVLLVFAIQDGEPGENRFGQNPKAVGV